MMTVGAGASITALVSMMMGGLLLWKGQQTSRRFGVSPQWLTTTTRFLFVIGWGTVVCGLLMLLLVGRLLLIW